MKFAVIGDIHSNIYALETALKHIKSKNIDFIICTGDLVGYAPFPNEVINKIREYNIITVQGNYDKAIGNSESICGCDYKDKKQLEMAGLSVLFTNMNINDENRDYLKELPTEIKFKFDNFKVLLVHGSSRKNNEYLFEDSIAVDEVTKEIEEDILICGHTHKPYYKIINGKHVINCGSVGKPKHGSPNLTYVVVHIRENNINVDINEIPYDYEKTAKAIEDNDMLPNEFANMLRKG